MQGQPAERERAALATELAAWMAEGIPPPSTPPDEQRFAAFAQRVFTYQFTANLAYRRYCEWRGVTPETLAGWQDIPAVATDAFKEASLTCFPPERSERIFETSGTTQGERRGRHYLRSDALYRAAALPNFDAHVRPDGRPLTPVVLFFAPAALPSSSLAHMFGMVTGSWGSAGSHGDGHTYFAGPAGLDLEGAAQRLAGLAAAGAPVLLMGAAFAFVHLLDHLATAARRIPLPAGSRIMDTGGYKGRSREVSKTDLYRMYTTALGIPDDHIVNEYGMTEMSSQFYDGVLRGERTRRKMPPPWVRTRVVDPETLAPVPLGTTGVLWHLDLANLDSVAALQTADLGVALHGGFEVLGRAAGSAARGCSLAVEDLLHAQR